jgi:small subunit ribosomal protein S8
MAMTDPIADMLTRIRNASAQKHTYVDVPMSKMKLELARVFKKGLFIKDYEVTRKGGGPRDVIRISLRYIKENTPVLTGLKRVSKPGLRVYVSRDEIASIEKGYGTAILSTPKGILSGRDARAAHTGGEVLCKVW